MRPESGPGTALGWGGIGRTRVKGQGCACGSGEPSLPCGRAPSSPVTGRGGRGRLVPVVEEAVGAVERQRRPGRHGRGRDFGRSSPAFPGHLARCRPWPTDQPRAIMPGWASVHPHVVPRYASSRHWHGHVFTDEHWGTAFGHERQVLPSSSFSGSPTRSVCSSHSGPGKSSVHQVSQSLCQSWPSLPMAKSLSAPSGSSAHRMASSSSWP